MHAVSRGGSRGLDQVAMLLAEMIYSGVRS